MSPSIETSQIIIVVGGKELKIPVSVLDSGVKIITQATLDANNIDSKRLVATSEGGGYIIGRQDGEFALSPDVMKITHQGQIGERGFAFPIGRMEVDALV